jgi:hypothetical protein
LLYEFLKYLLSIECRVLAAFNVDYLLEVPIVKEVTGTTILIAKGLGGIVLHFERASDSKELSLLNLFLKFLLKYILFLMDLRLLLFQFALHLLIEFFDWYLPSFLNNVGKFDNWSDYSFLDYIENSQQSVNCHGCEQN